MIEFRDEPRRVYDMGSLTTHVLDTARGIPGADIRIGAYFAQSGLCLPEPPFLDVVAVRFGIAAGDDHYHVPLLVSIWGYTTYRGS